MVFPYFFDTIYENYNYIIIKISIYILIYILRIEKKEIARPNDVYHHLGPALLVLHPCHPHPPFPVVVAMLCVMVVVVSVIESV